jgi:hypothetical protein
LKTYGTKIRFQPWQLKHRTALMTDQLITDLLVLRQCS